MRRFAPLVVLSLVACASASEMYAPMDSTPRMPKPTESVVLLASEPDRPYTTIGLIDPPSDEYDTLAEAIKAAREIAAQNGADALIIERRDAQTVPVEARYVWDSDTKTVVHLHAKAIVWK